jgi:hypothetical protein
MKPRRVIAHRKRRYAACGETNGCRIPVADHPVVLTVQGASLSLGTAA